MNDPWLSFLDALMSKKKPIYTQMGIAYMLQGDTPVSTADLYAKEKKAGDDWVEGPGAHMMVLVPDVKAMKNVPTNSKGGGSWIMWPDTPYARLMLPIDSYPPKK